MQVEGSSSTEQQETAGSPDGLSADAMASAIYGVMAGYGLDGQRVPDDSFIYIDPWIDSAVLDKLSAMCANAGRADDLLVIDPRNPAIANIHAGASPDGAGGGPVAFAAARRGQAA